MTYEPTSFKKIATDYVKDKIIEWGVEGIKNMKDWDKFMEDEGKFLMENGLENSLTKPDSITDQ